MEIERERTAAAQLVHSERARRQAEQELEELKALFAKVSEEASQREDKLLAELEAARKRR